MRHLDLFSGIGGFALAAQWAGMQTVGFSEIDEFACRVLAKNFPGVPNLGNIKEIAGNECGSVDIITGGYPCQPFSLAGERGGEKDDRHLWPEMFRIIKQARPTWVVCENVVGHVTMGLDNVLADLEAEGYSTRPTIIPACSKGAEHRRDRLWIVAYANSGFGRKRMEQSDSREACKRGENEEKRSNNREFAALGYAPSTGTYTGITHKPRVARMLNGVPDGVDRRKALGNAIVPQVAYEILRCIAGVRNELGR